MISISCTRGWISWLVWCSRVGEVSSIKRANWQRKRERRAKKLKRTLYLSFSSPPYLPFPRIPSNLSVRPPSFLQRTLLDSPHYSLRTYPKFRGRAFAQSSLISGPRFLRLGEIETWPSLVEMNLNDVGVIASTFSRPGYPGTIMECISSGERGHELRSAPLVLFGPSRQTPSSTLEPIRFEDGRVVSCGQFSRLQRHYSILYSKTL